MFFELSISTFLGFLSALLVEYLVKKHGEKALLNDTISGIKNELNTIYKRINELNNDSFYVNPLNISYWESIKDSESMNCILRCELYIEIVAVYQYIFNVNEWETIRANAFFITSNRKKELDAALEEQRKELSKEVEKLLKKI